MWKDFEITKSTGNSFTSSFINQSFLTTSALLMRKSGELSDITKPLTGLTEEMTN